MKLRHLPRLCIAASLCSLSWAMPSYAVGNVAIIPNIKIDEATLTGLVDEGEELGIKAIIDGDGTYDVYAALLGGILGPSGIIMFGKDGVVSPSFDLSNSSDIPELLKHRLMENVSLQETPLRERVKTLIPKMVLGGAGLAGTYSVVIGLTAPGDTTFNFLSLDQISVELK